MKKTLTCPECNARIPLEEALSHQVSEEIRHLEPLMRKRITQEIEEGVTQRIRDSLSREKELELQDLRNQLEERKEAAQRAAGEELTLRKKVRELEQAKAELDLEVERRTEERRQEFVKEYLERQGAEHRRQLEEKQAQLNAAQKQAEELQRRIAQGSQTLQGEVSQARLADRLKHQFPLDDISSVGKGKNGADVVQRVFSDQGGHPTGFSILWENKETKSFDTGWLPKLKADQAAVKANVGVLVTTAFPSSEKRPFYLEDGVWITKPQTAMELGLVLRIGLLQLWRSKVCAAQDSSVQAQVFQYFTSNDFRQRVVTQVEAIQALRENNEKERAALERLFSFREMQFKQLLAGTAAMLGDVQALIGRSVIEIPGLEIPVVPQLDGPTEPSELPKKYKKTQK